MPNFVLSILFIASILISITINFILMKIELSKYNKSHQPKKMILYVDAKDVEQVKREMDAKGYVLEQRTIYDTGIQELVFVKKEVI